ncbi:MAG: hypothetical protein KDC53_02700 [Saprospiraceae bacterium]|nr:hypothetical protein [Saprospiraceae bacterium]
MKYISLFLLLINHLNAPAQRVLFGNLENYLSDFIETLPISGSNVYHDPSFTEQENLSLAIKLLYQGHLPEAQEMAIDAGYEIIRYVDNSQEKNREFYGLQPVPGGTNYWGIYFLNPQGCRNLILQCPHPRLDTNTGMQGAYIFTHLDVKGLMISGTHRCNSIAPSSCSGTTSVCGANGPYRISDIAHNDRSIFQQITQALKEEINPFFLQLHGFAKLTGDPNLIISNGTRSTPEEDPIIKLSGALSVIDQTLTYKIIHIHHDWTRLTAFTNTQGRYLNNSTNPCLENATSSSGKFIHIEQEFDRLRKDEAGWELMRQALEQTFDCEITTGHYHHQEIPIEIAIENDHFTLHTDDSHTLWVEVYMIDGRQLINQPLVNDESIWVPDQSILILIVRDRNNKNIYYRKKIWVP